ncbi:MAG: alpha/beta fold hydrolase [Mycobacterium sp.]
MTIPAVTVTHLGGRKGLPVLLIGPSLGTSVTQLWRDVVPGLEETYHVVGWDLPGHGASERTTATFSMEELTVGVLRAVNVSVGAAPLYYSGVSVAGAVGLQLLLDHPGRVHGAALICTGAQIGDRAGWRQRAQLVRDQGTVAVAKQSEERWFAPGFTGRNCEAARRCADDLAGTDPESYAQVCNSLAEFDVRSRLPRISTPLVAVAGGHDVATPPASLRLIATEVQCGSYLEMSNCGHLPPVEDPRAIAHTLTDMVNGESR